MKEASVFGKWIFLFSSIYMTCRVFGGIGMLPNEPVEIGAEPQFFIDDYIVDNRWAIKYKKQAVLRVFHQPKKYEGNPLIANDGGYVNVLREEDTGLFRMWYQTHQLTGDDPKQPGKSRYAIAYAESKDGINWRLPKLDLWEWKGTKQNNICWRGIKGRASSPHLVDVPEHDRRGHRYVLLYKDSDGLHVIGSPDGLRWDGSSDVRIAHLHSDTNNAIVYDPRREEYVMFCRAKHLYRTRKGPMIDVGASRRVARMASKELWTEWESEPQNILIPDEADAPGHFHFFYGMPTHFHAGVYWGFLWPFKMNTDIYTELAFSRDGMRFERLPTRPRLIDLGPEGAWDCGMTFGATRWVEVGDEWWLYYAGHDGPHNSKKRKAGIGLTKLRKEGFISMRGPKNGGVVCTRKIKWPGGKLIVNADAHEGELKVRVSDAKRKPLPGFDYDDCVAFDGDSVSHEITWKEKSIDSLAGQIIRLEFWLTQADIYTFRSVQ